MKAQTMLRCRLAGCAAPLAWFLVLSAVLISTAGEAGAQTHSPAEHASDPRVGLEAGWRNAEEAIRNLRLVAHRPRPESFINPADPGDFSFMNADLAFSGNYVFQGGFNGIQVWDISNVSDPRLRTSLLCPGGQGDVSVYNDLLFMSVEETRGRLDCGTQGVVDTVSAERFRGVRVFDISDIEQPKQVAAVQTCRGSHTHTLMTDPDDSANVYIYVAGTSMVRPGAELAGCSELSLEEDPNTSFFRIEVIKVPLANPEQAAVVSTPRFLVGLVAPPSHGESPGDKAAAAEAAAAARARGEFTAAVSGVEYVLPSEFIQPLLDDLVRARGGTGVPTAADSAALHEQLPGIIAQMFDEPSGDGPRPGPTACHDVTVYPEVGLAGGACQGYGILLDINDPINPTRIDAVADSNFAYWHSATFNNAGDKVIFTDEWGGGMAPRCRETDLPEWGANAIFTRTDSTLRFASYYKLPAPQTAEENCVAHNGSLIPVPGRDIMVQAWYQGGVSVFDFTDPANPVEIAFFDRGPMDSTRLAMGGSWSAYWYNGHIYSSEIGRGLDILELTPSEHLSQNEIDAAKLVQFERFNPQHQTKLVWPASVVVARAYLDQLVRGGGIGSDRADRVATLLDQLETGPEEDTAVAQLAETASQLEGDAQAAEADQQPGDPDRLRLLASTIKDLSTTLR